MRALCTQLCIHMEICGHAPCRSVSGNTTFGSILFRSLILERSFGLSSLDSALHTPHPEPVERSHVLHLSVSFLSSWKSTFLKELTLQKKTVSDANATSNSSGSSFVLGTRLSIIGVPAKRGDSVSYAFPSQVGSTVIQRKSFSAEFPIK